MPRFTKPVKDEDGAAKPATVFEEVAAVIQRVRPEDMIFLHLGDTHSRPPPPALPEGLDVKRRPGFAQYCDTKGIPELKDLLVEKLKGRNAMDWVDRTHIQVTCGAIHALYAAFCALLDPGEEVMVLAPHWHMTNTVIAQAGGRARDLDFYIPLAENPDLDIPALLKRGLTEKTAAIYCNTPCNPTGKVLDRNVLQKIGDFAAAHDLWLVADEAYEDFIFTGAEHVSAATLPGMQDRTVSIFTFSKCLAAAGYRVGYAAAHPELVDRMHRASANTIYNAPTNNQHMVAQALHTWDDWFPGLYDKYKRNRDLVCEQFEGRFFAPEGSFYVFFDARDVLRGRDPFTLVEAMVRQGVGATPGRAFGEGFEEWFRFCFVAVPEERLAQGIDRLNRVLEEEGQ